jgi:hypothetical protein
MEKRKVALTRHFARNRRARLSILPFLLSIFLWPILLGGCAAPAEPSERKPPTPEAVKDLAVEQLGDAVILTFTLPKESVDHREFKKPLAIEVYRDFPSAPAAATPTSTPSAKPTLLVTIPSSLVDHYATQGHIRFADSLKAEDYSRHAGSEAVYTVRTGVSWKKPSADSNLATLTIFPPPEPIEDVRAEVTESGVTLRWTPPQRTLIGPALSLAGYRIYRAEPAPAAADAMPPENPKLKSPFTRIAVVTSHVYSDTQVEFRKTYIYTVRSIAQYPGETLESADSRWISVTVRDTNPPTAPQGIVIVFVPAAGESPSYLELSWAINPETNVVGYNVYRSEQESATGTRLNPELLLTPAFQDMNAAPGRRYFYTATAVDRSGNESAPSAATSGGVPAESQSRP